MKLSRLAASELLSNLKRVRGGKEPQRRNSHKRVGHIKRSKVFIEEHRSYRKESK